jgi:predicted nucleotidyltransferase
MSLQTQSPTRDNDALPEAVPLNEVLAAAESTGLDNLLLVEYGSRAYGTATAASDRDLLGVYVEHDHQIYGLEAAETQKFRLHHGVLVRMGTGAIETRSHPEDIDVHFHPLRKFVSLAAAGNPTLLNTLWTPDDLKVLGDPAAELLFSFRASFLSKHAGYRHAGYARAQRDALLGLTNKRTKRPELLEMHGYDTKHASHLIRLLLVGLDLVRERTVHLPMKPEQIELLLEIRRGELNLADVLALAEKLEHELTDETTESRLPDSVDFDFINHLLRRVRNEHLGRTRA